MKSILVGLKMLLIPELHLVLQNIRRAPSKTQKTFLVKAALLVLVGHSLRAGAQ